MQGDLKKKDPLFPPSTVSEFLEWLRLLMDVVRTADWDEVFNAQEWFSKDDFYEEMGVYYQIFQRMSKGTTVRTLFALDNRLRAQAAARGDMWTSWTLPMQIDAILEIANAENFAKHCDNCSSIFCCTVSCRYQRVEKKKSSKVLQLGTPGIGRRDRGNGTANRSRLCFDWEAGKECRFGEKCKFDHPVRPRRSPRRPPAVAEEKKK